MAEKMWTYLLTEADSWQLARRRAPTPERLLLEPVVQIGDERSCHVQILAAHQRQQVGRGECVLAAVVQVEVVIAGIPVRGARVPHLRELEFDGA